LAPLFDFASSQKKIEENEALMNAAGFWDDQKKAQSIIRETNALKALKENYDRLHAGFADLAASVDELKSNFDKDLAGIVEEEYKESLKNFDAYEIQVLLSHPYDSNNAILELHPGAGGTEAMDWAEMLYRMYCRWAERRGFKVTVLDYQEGEEAGIKSCSILIEGPMAYGYLKAEKGVHRLVRISPFDAAGRRHTSFTSVDVMPQFEDDVDITIDPQDLDIITMRASGAGGQHINKTDSAVRIVHVPTGITVNCQEGRSQIENRETAMRLIKSRVYEELKRRREEAEGKIRREKIGTGDRSEKIRTYNYPQNRVTDHRIGLTITQLDRIMEGRLDGIIKGLQDAEEQKKLESLHL
jgi:peptide chain release factor 2